MTSISASDAAYLECVAAGPFQPIGWLYAGVFERLREKALVRLDGQGRYVISDEGAAQLKAFRE